MSTAEQPMSASRRLIATGFAGAILVSISLPHALLPASQASFVAVAISLCYSIVLGVLLREGGARVQLGVGVIALLSLILTSACVGVFFHLPLKAALLYFTAIAVGGTILLTAISMFLCVKVFPDFLRDRSGGKDADDQTSAAVN